MYKENRFSENAVLAGPSAHEWTEKGGKTLGTICCYVTEELIDAAGILPYRIRATGCVEDSRGKAALSTYSCSYARSCLSKMLEGDYDFLDGAVCTDGCMQAQRFFDYWRLNDEPKFSWLITVPRLNKPEAVQWYRDELSNLKGELEKLTGQEIDDDTLRASIKKYNETRELIRSLYDRQKSEPPAVSGAELLEVTLAAMSMPKDTFNESMKEYLKELDERPALENGKARLMVVGSGIDNPDYIKLIEDHGAHVVTDVQCFGTRYLWESVELIDEDPLMCLAEAYLTRPTCPRMLDIHESLFDLIADMAQDFNVEGIVYVTMRNCDLWGGEQQIFEERFKKLGIPLLQLDREEITLNEGQVGVRVDAFVEMINGGGN